MKNFNFKKLMPHLVAVVIFFVVAVVYCKPALTGQVVSQHDIQGWRGMAQQSFEFEEKYGHYPLWTNSMFSGMPAFQIMMGGSIIHLHYFYDLLTLWMPKPISFFFLACLGFYFLCIIARANPWVSIMGGIAYAYSTFDPIIVAVGHDTQMISLGFAPFVIGGILLLFQRKYWAGLAVTSLFSALLIMQNHVQIVYYTLIIAVIMTIAYFIKSYKEKQIAHLIKGVGLAAVAGIIGLICSAVTMLPTYEYAKESMRGGRSELTLGDTNVKTKGGLDKDYAFRYSFGFVETFTFIVPGLYGGSNGGDEYTTDSKFVKAFSQLGVPEEQAVQYANSYSYWGDQPTTSGPVYLGAIVCLLFIFGMIYLKSWYKWWLLITSIVGLILAFGANLKGLNFFLFDYLPLYNKFRAPTMALVIPQFCFPLVGVLAISKLIKEEFDPAEMAKKLKLTAIISGVIIVILTGFYFTADFTGRMDAGLKENIQQSLLTQVPAGQEVPAQLAQQAQSVSSGIIAALQSDRQSLMGGDLLRTAILMALGLLLMYFFTKKKLTSSILIGGLLILTSFDLLGVATRYLNQNNFIDESQFEAVFIPTEADRQIMSDPDHNNFRVFNQTVDVFNDATTSYHHNSVGGYHPAKLDLYNDLITYQLSKGNMQVFNMLNTKYFITQNPQSGRPMAQLNPEALGNAWLVSNIKYVGTADEEMLALDSTDLAHTAIVKNKFKDQIKTAPEADSGAYIKLKENLNDHLTYTFHSSKPQVAVFSEVYYPYGWNAYLDGKKADYFKSNYLLRTMYVPAGDHQIEFKFEPASYTTGRMVSVIGTIIVLLIIIGAIVYYVRRKPKPNAHVL
ncbi:MAG: hypothetical protein ABIN48_05420 [Ginsengibacter sp.]